MKKIAKLWLPFEVASSILTFINPYIGIFSMFTFIELFILGVVNINIVVRKKVNGPFDKQTLGALRVMGTIIPIIFFVIKAFVNIGCYSLATIQNRVLLPFNLLENAMWLCFPLLIVVFILNVLAAAAFIGKVRGE